MIKLVNIVNKKNSVNVSFSNGFLTWYKSKWWKKFKWNTKPNFKYCIFLSVQNGNTQQGFFVKIRRGFVWYGHPNLVWAKKTTINVFFYLLSSYELLGYFSWFVVSKSLCIEVFRTGLVYYQWSSHTPSYCSACNFFKMWTPSHVCFNSFNELYQTAH